MASKIDPLSPIAIVLATFSFEFVAPLIFYSIHYEEVDAGLRQPISEGDTVMAILIAGCWLGGWLAAYKMAGGRASIPSEPSPIWPQISFPLAIALLSVFLFTAPPTIAALVQFHPASGQQFRSSLTSGVWGAVLFAFVAASTAAFLGLVALASGRFKKSRGGFTRFSIIAMFALCALVFCWSLWTMGGRGRAFFPILASAFIVHYCIRPFRLWEAVAGGAGAATLIVVFMGRGELGGLVNSLFGVSTGRNFDGFYTLAAISHHFAGAPSLWGSGIFHAVLSDFGINAGNSTRQVMMPTLQPNWTGQSGLNPTKAGELFINFGIIGTIIGGAISGAVSAIIYRKLACGGALGFVSVPLYVFIIWNLGTANFRGYMFESLTYSTVLMVSVLALWALVMLFVVSRPIRSKTIQSVP